MSSFLFHLKISSVFFSSFWRQPLTRWLIVEPITLLYRRTDKFVSILKYHLYFLKTTGLCSFIYWRIGLCTHSNNSGWKGILRASLVQPPAPSKVRSEIRVSRYHYNNYRFSSVRMPPPQSQMKSPDCGKGKRAKKYLFMELCHK